MIYVIVYIILCLLVLIVIPFFTLMTANRLRIPKKISFKNIILILLIRIILIIGVGGILLQSYGLLAVVGVPFVIGTIVTSLFISYTNNDHTKKSWILGVSIEATNEILRLLLLFALYSFTGIYSVTGISMNPTLNQGDIIVTSKNINTIARGSIIVYERPAMSDQDKEKLVSNMTESQKSDFLKMTEKSIKDIKRVIGLPGETINIKDNNINICKDGRCFEFHEPYLSGKTLRTNDCKKSSFNLTDGYFVLGDNIEKSTDSLCCFGFECTGDNTTFQVLPKQIKGILVFSLPLK